MRILLSGLVLLLAATPLAAQKGSFNSGLRLHGNFHYNRSTVDGVGDIQQAEHGYGLGVELSGENFALGLYGFAQGRPRAFDSRETPVHLVLEANYYLPMGSLRLAPFAGIHTGLGVFTRDYFGDPFLPRPRDGLGGLGYQFGARFQPFSSLGIEAQLRQHAESVFDALGPDAERRQILVGVVVAM